MELLKPYIATHMEISGIIGSSSTLSTHPLLHNTSLQNQRCFDTTAIVVL